MCVYEWLSELVKVYVSDCVTENEWMIDWVKEWMIRLVRGYFHSYGENSHWSEIYQYWICTGQDLNVCVIDCVRDNDMSVGYYRCE